MINQAVFASCLKHGSNNGSIFGFSIQ